MIKTDTDDRFTKVAFGVLTTLIATGVIGVWSMSITLGRLDERVAISTKIGNEKMDSISSRVDRVATDQRDAERRIGVLEGKAPR